MQKELKYTSQDLFDIKCLKDGWKKEIDELNTQKRIIDGKIEVLYSNIDRLERHIVNVETQNNVK